MEVFDKILELYQEIDDIYKTIIVLEYENKFSDDRYLSLINLLKEKIKLEKKLFNQFLDNDREGYEWVVNLLENKMIELEDYVISRLYDYMSIHISQNPKGEVDSIDEQMEIESINRVDKLYREFSKNLYLIYLSFMGDYINSFAFLLEKKALLSFKYFGSLTNHDMEEVLVYHSFNVGKCNFVDVNVTACGLKIDKKLTEEVSYIVYLDAIRTSVIELLSFNDSDYNDVYMKTNCISACCMLRSGLLLLSDNNDRYNEVINEIFKLIDDMRHFYNGLSIDIINSVVNSVNMDKKRIRKLFLKL